MNIAIQAYLWFDCELVSAVPDIIFQATNVKRPSTSFRSRLKVSLDASYILFRVMNFRLLRSAVNAVKNTSLRNCGPVNTGLFNSYVPLLIS